MSLQNQMFAVAVRDGQLFLFLRVRRAATGDVYVMFPTGRSDKEWHAWNPHTSRHSDGQQHHKSFNRILLPPMKKQMPDANFSGTECLIQRPIARHEPRSFGVLCNPDEFSEVFEIPVDEVRPEKYRTALSVDLSEPATLPIFPCGAVSGSTIIRQRVFQDAIPWIVITFYEMGML